MNCSACSKRTSLCSRRKRAIGSLEKAPEAPFGGYAQPAPQAPAMRPACPGSEEAHLPGGTRAHSRAHVALQLVRMKALRTESTFFPQRGWRRTT